MRFGRIPFHINVTRRTRHRRAVRLDRRLGPLLGLALVLVATAPAAAADGSGTVPGSVTVEPTVACLLVSGSYDFGTQRLATPGTPAQAHPAAAPATIENCAGQTQDLLVSGTDASGTATPPATWVLDPAVATSPCQANTYAVTTRLAAGVPTGISTLPAHLTSILPTTSVNVDASLFMPCTGSSGGGETMTFSVVYTAMLADATGPFEVEPNDDQGSATPLVVGVNTASSIYGTIAPVSDRDQYRVQLQPGNVTIETSDASGADTCASIDTVILVVNGSNNTTVGVDDDSGVGQCSRLVTNLTSPTTLFITVTDYNNDSPIPGYRLRVAHG